jgi:hypothetical protein
MALNTNDLLYAHGCLCEYARNNTFDLWEAHRSCDVINNFQNELRSRLKPDACDFTTNGYRVYPIGGWND